MHAEIHGEFLLSPLSCDDAVRVAELDDPVNIQSRTYTLKRSDGSEGGDRSPGDAQQDPFKKEFFLFSPRKEKVAAWRFSWWRMICLTETGWAHQNAWQLEITCKAQILLPPPNVLDLSKFGRI